MLFYTHYMRSLYVHVFNVHVAKYLRTRSRSSCLKEPVPSCKRLLIIKMKSLSRKREIQHSGSVKQDYPGIEANIPDPGLHADFPGIQANLPGSRTLRKNPTFHTGLASCARIFCRTALQCSQVRARQHA